MNLSTLETPKALPRLIFRLSGQIVPKARPRVTSSGTFMPENYTLWKKYAIRSLSEQKLHHLIQYPINSCKIRIICKGIQHLNSDADNITGSIFDALVQSKVIKNDNLVTIKEFSFRYIQSNEKLKIVIEITPIKSNDLYIRI